MSRAEKTGKLPWHKRFELAARGRCGHLFYFNDLKLGPKTPIAPSRGEYWPFGERFGCSLRSPSLESTAQTPGRLEVFQAVSPAESSWRIGWWRPRRDSNPRPPD